MNEDKEKEKKSKKECRLDTIDSQGHSNLCCCYIMEKNGNYTDPCNIPADNCC